MSINIDFQDNGDNKHGTRCAGEVRKVAPKHFIISDFGVESLHTKNIFNFIYIRSLQSPLTSSAALVLSKLELRKLDNLVCALTLSQHRVENNQKEPS